MARKDFSKPREAIEFTIGSETFAAEPAIPAGVMIDAAVKMDGLEKATLSEQVGAYTDVLRMCLTEESYGRFQARMSKGATDPIDIQQLMDITMWLFEVYGLRPTTPSEASSDSPSDPAPGITSTDAPLSVELISASSPSIAS